MRRLHDELLAQAHRLATTGRGRPKRVDLRRAVSSAYYALFHLLTSSATALFVEDPRFASRIKRTFGHREMREVSSRLVENKLPKGVAPLDGHYSTPADLRLVADALLDLQQARHDADYDLARDFSRREALEFVRLSQNAFDAWRKIKKSDDARLYLACFLLWERWDKKPR